MADLNQLFDALEVIRQNRKTAKVFFYFVNKEDSRMHSGFFSISEGKSCCIHYLNKSNENALAEIPQLHLTKVMTLPATLMDLSNQPFPACKLDEVILALRPVDFIEPPVSAEPEAQSTQAQIATLTQPHTFYSHEAIQDEAVNLLESLFGPSAKQRVAEIALVFPPHQYPIEFTNKCKLHASMMVGPIKAGEIFQLLYKKLANEDDPRNAGNHLT